MVTLAIDDDDQARLAHDILGDRAHYLLAIFQNAPIGITLTDLHGYVLTNRAYQQLVGYPTWSCVVLRSVTLHMRRIAITTRGASRIW